MYAVNIIKSFFDGRTWHTHHLVGVLALFLTLFDNLAFFEHLGLVYARTNPLFMVGLFFVLLALNYFLLSLLSSRWTVKPVAVFFLIASAAAAYHMDTFDVAIDRVMLQNVVQTQTSEAVDLFTVKFLVYLLVLGVLPVVWVLRQRVHRASFKFNALKKLKWMGFALLVVALTVGVFNKSAASFAREHKSVRFYINPLTYTYSLVQFVVQAWDSQPKNFQAIGTDAVMKAPVDGQSRRKLMILIVGETARADRWSLNGYGKETNPLLSKESNLVSLREVASCGTSTAVSVPCMFSVFGRAGYSDKKFNNTENVLDVLKRAGVQILWRDNNSSSKGVADRVAFEDFKERKLNTICEDECRDEGMLVGLPAYIQQQQGKDVLIVLHTMGSHGPAYFKRYPKAFEKFTPACQDNQLENCSVEAIGNAFDNTIVYSDYVIAKTLALLKTYQAQFDTSLIYMSDHGESLGENGVFLHGMPYAIAPIAQKNPAAAIWVGNEFNGVRAEQLKTLSSQALSHDYLFHSLLGGFGVQTQVYRPELDVFELAKKSSVAP